MEKKEEKKVCCICGKEYEGYGYMEEKQKVQVVFEFDRSEYDAYLFLMNQKKTKEVEQIWNTMSGEPVVADIDLFEEDSQSVKLMMISLAILSVEKKVKG